MIFTSLLSPVFPALLVWRLQFLFHCCLPSVDFLPASPVLIPILNSITCSRPMECEQQGAAEAATGKGTAEMGVAARGAAAIATTGGNSALHPSSPPDCCPPAAPLSSSSCSHVLTKGPSPARMQRVASAPADSAGAPSDAISLMPLVMQPRLMELSGAEEDAEGANKWERR
ncbi:unnamed protein product [Closterium sp. NIES-53]